MNTIIITGASSGVGRALTLHLAAAGHTVCALARSEDKLDQVAAEYPANIDTYPTDISIPDQVQRVFGVILKKYTKIDVLINNAGIVRWGNFWEQDFELIDQTIDTNLKGTIYCTRMVIPTMIAHRDGRIINLVSTGGIGSSPRGALYVASKHGQVGFGYSMAEALKPYNILVTTLCPGGIDTPLWDKPHSQFMKPEEIAELVAWLLQQPRHILYKTLTFFPTCEWH